MGVGKCAISQHPVTVILMDDKSKNPYPLRKRWATAGAPGTSLPVASWLLGPDGCLFGTLAISQWWFML